MSVLDISIANYKLAQDIEKYARIKTYGLHYDTDFWEMFGRKMILDVLDLDNFFGLFTDIEKECLIAKLKNPRQFVGISGCGCS